MPINWSQWPSTWPREPPGYERPPFQGRGELLPDLRSTLYEHRRGYWITAVVLALIAGQAANADYFALVLLIAGAIYGGAILYNNYLERTFDENLEKTARLAQANMEKAWKQWFSERLMRQLPKAEYPSVTARQYLVSHGASAVLGIDSTIHQDFVMVGPRQSVVVIGPSGSSKTMGIAIPSVSLHPGPAVFSSTKTDGLRHTARARSALGRLWLYDPSYAVSDQELSQIEQETGTRIYRAFWSPLLGVRDWDDAKLSAKDVVTAAKYGENSDTNSQHWNITSEEYLAPMLLAAALHPDTSMNDVRQWVRHRTIEPCEAILHAISHNPDYSLDAELALDSLMSRKGDRNVKHSSDVWSTLNTLVQAYEFKAGALYGHRQNFDPRAFVRSFDTLYIAGQAKRQEAAAPLYIALIDSLYDATVELDHRQPFAKGDRPSLLVTLDEAANTAPSPRLIRYLSEGLGQGFQLMVLLQSGAQAETIWRHHGRALLDFATVKVIFGGISNEATLNAFSVLTGDFDRRYVSSTQSRSLAENWSQQEGKSWSLRGGVTNSEGTSSGGSWNFGSSETVSHRKERQMSAGDIATIAPGEALVVMNQKWQIVRAGGSLISAWLDILRTPRTPVQGFLEPREIQRPTLNLAEVDDLMAWRRETKAALKQTRGQGAPYGDDDDDDDGSPTYALGGPSWS